MKINTDQIHGTVDEKVDIRLGHGLTERVGEDYGSKLPTPIQK